MYLRDKLIDDAWLQVRGVLVRYPKNSRKDSGFIRGEDVKKSIYIQVGMDMKCIKCKNTEGIECRSYNFDRTFNGRILKFLSLHTGASWIE